MENPLVLITLLAIGFAVFFAIQAAATRKRTSAEDKVMKGYFLLGLSGLMAKIAMADGVVTEDESEMAIRFFKRMELTDAERSISIGNFVSARRDGLTARDHAKRFMAYANTAASEFLYDMLWRISRIDGRVDAAEDKLLGEIATYLGLSTTIYENFKNGKKPRHDAEALRAAGVPSTLVALAH